MPELDRIRDELTKSSDPDNPGVAEVAELLRSARRIAVVGMSRDPTKAARRVPSYMAARGFEVIPVNPHADRILGRPVFRELADIEEPVDLVLVFRPSVEAGRVLREAAARPEHPAIWLQEGIRADDEAALARAQGRTVLQDICLYKVHRALDLEMPG